MSTTRSRRIAKEIEETRSDVFSKVNISTAGDTDDLSHLSGDFQGPPDTPYEGGHFFIDIRIPNDYPYRPPLMKFVTKIWHPNVSSQTGAICLDTLSHNWSPVLTLKLALISIQGLLASPEPKDPQDAEVAGMMLKNPEEFAHKAREWAERYANAAPRGQGESSGGTTSEQLEERANTDRMQRKDDDELSVYRGYNKDLVDRFCAMGFDVNAVVSAMEFVGIDRNHGEDYELEEEYMGDITARLFGEP